MKERITTTQWLDVAVSGIRFGPDRRAVREELEAHIEDKMADLRRIFPDIPTEEAADRALGGMGDPKELKVSLAKIHKPWLGWLWRASQVLSGALLGLTAVSAPFLLLILLISLPDWEFREGIFGSRETVWDREPAAVWVPDPGAVRVDDCRLTMSRAWLTEDESGPVLLLDIRLTSPLIWVEGHDFCYKTAAVDSLGNTYTATWDWPDRPERCVSGWQSPRNRSVLPALFWERYVLRVAGVDPEADWVRLEYSWLGREFSMTARREGV